MTHAAQTADGVGGVLPVELAVLHAVGVHELASTDEVADLLGIAPASAAAALAAAVERGAATELSGRYRTTAHGRERIQQAYPTVFEALRQDADARSAFARFDTLNQQLLATLTEWQTVSIGGERVPNDHMDPQHDARVLDRLDRLVERTEAALRPWARHDPLPDRFLSRMRDALDRADSGDLRWIAAVGLPSLHTLWFELHEHLLRALGRDRVQPPDAP